jgi:hypothetical protein
LQKEDGEWTLVDRSPAAMAENHEEAGSVRRSGAGGRHRGRPIRSHAANLAAFLSAQARQKGTDEPLTPEMFCAPPK